MTLMTVDDNLIFNLLFLSIEAHTGTTLAADWKRPPGQLTLVATCKLQYWLS